LISVVIPVKDGGGDLVRCLDAIARQRIEDDVEVVVIDSGSADGSPERAERLGARVHEIPASEFHHGRTRNLGAELARGDTLVFTSQDAYAADELWLSRLTAPLGEESVAGAYGRQLPHHDARPPERYFLDFLYGAEPRRQRLRWAEELTFEATLFSNVNSAMRRGVWAEYRFDERIIMSEDQEWSRRVLLAGLEIVYSPEAAVHHSHAYSVADAVRRFFDSGVSAEHSYVGDSAGSSSALRKAGARYARGELEWLWTTGQRRWIPYAVVYEAAKFAGLQLGRRHRLLPTAVKARLSAYPAHWKA
jgi:rhamnosyltransferase